jgi:hypothetical protein
VRKLIAATLAADGSPQPSQPATIYTLLTEHVPTLGVFPLFVSSKQWLRLLDGACAQPFFPRDAEGQLQFDPDDAFGDPDGVGAAVDLLLGAAGEGLGDAQGAEEQDGDAEDVAARIEVRPMVILL